MDYLVVVVGWSSGSTGWIVDRVEQVEDGIGDFLGRELCSVPATAGGEGGVDLGAARKGTVLAFGRKERH